MNPLASQRHEEEDDSGQARLARQIDSLYDQMRSLVASYAGRPGLREALQPLREKMRALQELEAEEVLRRYDSNLRPGYTEAERLINQARRLSTGK